MQIEVEGLKEMKRTPTLLATVLAGALMCPVKAQQQYGEDGRGVARISVINGDVSVKRGDSGDVVAAGINAPLTVQDTLLTGPSSRAEIQFDYANAIRVGASSEVRLSELSEGKYQIQVGAGATTFRVLRENQSQIEIATPTVAVRPLGPGTYRISVFQDGSTEITIRSGAADVYTPRGSQRVEAGQTLVARGSPQDPEFQVTAAVPMDDWDRYNADRDREVEASRSYQYVSPDVTGAEDLDRYGQWQNVAPYGQVWVPSVDPGWAPYRYGQWAWTDWYGWTWVSHDPWGWAPYHYGRWFWGGPHGWCWYPGGYGHQYWSPALVAFFGFGTAGVGVGFGWGNVGWVPLAPYESFHPWWGHGYYGHTNITNVTVVNNTNITNIYRNARVTNGITAVTATDFGRARITNGNLVRVGQGEIARANLVRGQLPLAPGRESLVLSDRQVRTANLPRVNPNRQFFSHSQPQPVERISFEQQRQTVEAAARRAFGNTAAPATSAQSSGRAGWPRSAPSTSAGSARQVNEQPSGWHQFGEPSPARQAGTSRAPSGQAYTAQPNAPAGRTPSGQDGTWRRFGEPSSSYRAAPQSGMYRSPEPAPRYQAPVTPYSAPPRSESGYQRFGQAVPQYEPRYEPRSGYGSSAGPPRESGHTSAPAPVRINPPIVSSRPAPSRSAPRSESRSAPSRGSDSSHGRR
jgi:hypothetical protein